MSYPFPSVEWTAALCEAVNTSAAYAKAAKKWEGDLILQIDDQRGVYLDLWHGECRKATYYEDAGEVDAEFCIAASMKQWRDILTGKLDPIQALMKRQLKLDGNLVKILKNVKAAQELVVCAASIPSDFDR